MRKKIKCLIILITFVISFLVHFIYDWFPNTIFSIFFPVNESIWEHMKLLFTTILIGDIVEYLIFKQKKIKNNNYLFLSFFESIISIPIFLIIYLPIYYRFGENMILNISLLLITIIIVKNIKYNIFNKKDIHLEKISIILLIVSYIIFGILTYYPIRTHLFYDTHNEIYGIKKNN